MAPKSTKNLAHYYLAERRKYIRTGEPKKDQGSKEPKNDEYEALFKIDACGDAIKICAR